MSQTDILMLSVCIPILLMVGVLLALVLKEEFDKNIWPFNKKEDNE